jgi:hypothetical protein
VKIEPHIRNFLESVKSRREPNGTIEGGVADAAAPQLANVAFRQQKLAKLSEALER